MVRMCQGGKPETGKLHTLNVCGSAYENGCGQWHVAMNNVSSSF